MVDKITSPISVNGLIEKTNAIIDAIPTSTTQLTNDSGFITSSALSGYQTTANLVTTMTSASTDSTYPSAKAVFEALQTAGGSAMVVVDYT